jgi:hypothetical protein
MTLREMLKHSALRGVALCNCAAQDKWDDANVAGLGREIAHAHIRGRYLGWICIRKLGDYNATTIRHELAHLVRGGFRHDEAWRRVVRELGGQVERGYRKRVA